ncbi:hypothetical protein BCF53_11934 [Reinekea marinisedimentorum]|uniref:Uncharacterized protein n=1 Tax=Reinekea marinisedimentorum TaxID=230495 RepID=A0A4R3HWS7_9GAMM|nr:hypothetical protein BCF53_11934 [Reinekea marinisedimentorum]
MVIAILAICAGVLLAYSQQSNQAAKPVPIKIERDEDKRR